MTKMNDMMLKANDTCPMRGCFRSLFCMIASYGFAGSYSSGQAPMVKISSITLSVTCINKIITRIQMPRRIIRGTGGFQSYQQQ